MSIVTKSGDNGTTIGPHGRVPKYDPFVETVGTLDELQAHLGLVYSFLKKNKTYNVLLKDLLVILYNIQGDLYRNTQFYPYNLAYDLLEKLVKEVEAELPPLKNFVLPGSNPLNAVLHIARTVCRRAERQLIQYIDDEDAQHMSEAVIFLNRLSDFLFILARKFDK